MPPSARPRIWWPRQMPKIGSRARPASRTVLADRPPPPPDRPGRSRGRSPSGRSASACSAASSRRHHGHVEALLDEQAQDVALDAEVVGDEPVAAARARAARGTWPSTPAQTPSRPRVRRRAGHLGDEVAPVERRRAARAPRPARLRPAAPGSVESTPIWEPPIADAAAPARACRCPRCPGTPQRCEEGAAATRARASCSARRRPPSRRSPTGTGAPTRRPRGSRRRCRSACRSSPRSDRRTTDR